VLAKSLEKKNKLELYSYKNMKKKDLIDIRKKTLENLTKLVDGKRSDLIKEKAKISAGKSKNVKKMRRLKKDLAQILSIIKEKEIININKGDIEYTKKSERSVKN
jgi:ribosomal protein L29